MKRPVSSITRLLASFAPPDDASPAEVRRVGARNALLGVILMAFGVFFVLSLDRLARGALLDPTAERPSKLRAVSGLPVLLGFLATVVGSYRVITGVHPRRDGAGAGSRLGRIVLAALISAALLAAIVGALLALS
ncbi:MAG: hypothetical protein HYV09_04930 [Deltaproteobacteria bacterium]|nr:hypothetical protein [Deltaproteobacteria bacterium]